MLTIKKKNNIISIMDNKLKIYCVIKKCQDTGNEYISCRKRRIPKKGEITLENLHNKLTSEGYDIDNPEFLGVFNGYQNVPFF